MQFTGGKVILCAMLLIFMSLIGTKIQQEGKTNYPEMWGEGTCAFPDFYIICLLGVFIETSAQRCLISCRKQASALAAQPAKLSIVVP